MMIFLSTRTLLAIAAVVDIAINARPLPVSSKTLSERHKLPPRHLETMLQTLVQAGILKGVRGPKGGYALARERRRITAGDIVRATLNVIGDNDNDPQSHSDLVSLILYPALKEAGHVFLERLDEITVEDLCQSAEIHDIFMVSQKKLPPKSMDFAI
jgi:Rrf2 family transcriptional regulator, iron-sulfur cluster assembly transcription factor